MLSTLVRVITITRGTLVKRVSLLVPLDERASFRALEEDGFILSFSEDTEGLEAVPLDPGPDILVLDIGGIGIEHQVSFVDWCKSMEIPVLAVISPDNISRFDYTLGVEDFIFKPIGNHELRMRVRRVLWRTGSWDTGQVIRNGDLVIDQERYEISVAGRRVILTFKEYQLLCLLAGNPGRVYSRETLLSRVWGYDYFGGTRTVDVHIRRLRSKVEDSGHQFIETVRNVGYRFRIG